MAFRQTPQSRLPAKGFTLIEILVVIAILVILIGLAVAVGSNVQLKAKIRTTKTTLATLDTILTAYQLDAGGAALPAGPNTFIPVFAAMPNQQRAFASLKPYLSSSPGHLNDQINDAFGTPIELVISPKLGFRSAGPDCLPGTTDDIFSWDPAN